MTVYKRYKDVTVYPPTDGTVVIDPPIEQDEALERKLRSIPTQYEFSEGYKQIAKAPGLEQATIRGAIDSVSDQLYVEKATWGLKYWEEILGIETIDTDSYDVRRSRVLSAWRGVGKLSADLIKLVALAYTNGNVDVSVNSTTQQITITFCDAVGRPPNITDLYTAIDNIMHAHLEVVYKFRYLTINEVQALTVAQMETHQLTDFAPFVPV